MFEKFLCKIVHLQKYSFLCCCRNIPAWAHEMMWALMWFWFQTRNINCSSQLYCSFALKLLMFIGDSVLNLRWRFQDKLESVEKE